MQPFLLVAALVIHSAFGLLWWFYRDYGNTFTTTDYLVLRVHTYEGIGNTDVSSRKFAISILTVYSQLKYVKFM